jgi:Uma2 family endonuclease
MNSTTLVSVGEYLNSSHKPVCEYIDGVLHPKPIPTKLHALIQFLIVSMLRAQNVEALAEVTVRLTETKFLVPNVIADYRIQDPYPTEPVALCVGILSPEDRLSAAFAKCEQYHEWGVPSCWVVDPQKQTAWEYHAGADPNRIEMPGILRAQNLSIRSTQLFQPTE